MSTIYVMEAANLFAGDDDPTKSKHLTLINVKLPVMQEAFVDHRPTGSAFAMRLGMNQFDALECTFKLNGLDPDLMAKFGIGQKGLQKYTARGNVVDKQDGREFSVISVMRGRLAKVEHDAFTRGELMGADYSISEINHYELIFDSKEKYYWDLFTDQFRIDGADVNNTERANLGLI